MKNIKITFGVIPKNIALESNNFTIDYLNQLDRKYFEFDQSDLTFRIQENIKEYFHIRPHFVDFQKEDDQKLIASAGPYNLTFCINTLTHVLINLPGTIECIFIESRQKSSGFLKITPVAVTIFFQAFPLLTLC